MQTRLVLKRQTALKLRFQPGATGPAGTVEIGSTTTGAPGTDAAVTNTGTPHNSVLQFTIPRGDKGDIGDKGDAGDNGWTPILATISDGARRVHQVIDWAGGTGTKPVTGGYIGLTGLVPNIADGIDIRGPAGTATIPDGDKGDLTTSSGGDVWGINPGAVGTAKLADKAATFAKIQDIVTATLLGRLTAGNGSVEALTPAQARQILEITTAGAALIMATTTAAQRAAMGVPAVPISSSGVGQFGSFSSALGGALALAAGGTWAWFAVAIAQSSGGLTRGFNGGVDAGGTTVQAAVASSTWSGICWRIA